LRVDGAVAMIVFKRPASLNAFTLPMARELLRALRVGARRRRPCR
jgi:enoyl-CoA hydratase/carnithine racemase